MREDRAIGRVTASLGAALLLLAIIMGAVDSALAERCARPFATIIFELGGFDATRALLTGPCGHERAEALIWTSWLDIALFIPLCASFMIAAARLVSGKWRGVVAILVIALMSAASIADWIETFAQLRVLDWVTHHRGWDFDAAATDVALNLHAARAKFILHGASLALLAFAAFFRKPDTWRVTGVLLVAPIFGMSAAMHDADSWSWLLLLAFGIAWLTLIYVGVRTARARHHPPPEEKPRERWEPWRNPGEGPPEPL